MTALFFCGSPSRASLPERPLIWANYTNTNKKIAASLCILTNKKFPKPIDKCARVWYNKHSKREEGIAHDKVPHGYESSC